MRTIAIEEHFLADGFREVMKRDPPSQGGSSNAAFVAGVRRSIRASMMHCVVHVLADEIDWVKAQEFWAFRAPVGSARPQIKNSRWPTQPLDYLVGALL